MTAGVAGTVLIKGTQVPVRVGKLPMQLSQFLDEIDAVHFVLLWTFQEVGRKSRAKGSSPLPFKALSEA
jgi:hypothetical protein